MVFFRKYSQKYYEKKVPAKYRRYGKQINSSPSLGQLAKRINYVKSLLNVEYKTFDTFVRLNAVVPTISSVTTMSHLLNIPQGVTETTRVGNSLKLKRVFLRFMINANATSAVPQNVRIMLVRDTNRDVNPNGTSGALVTLGNVLKPDNPTTGQVDNICAPLNDATSGRYNVIMNKIVSLDRQARSGVLIEKYFKMNNDVKYSIDSETLPINSLYMVICTDNAANPPTVTGLARITYIDN